MLERYSHQERIIKEQQARLDEHENRMKEQEVKKIEEGGYRKGNRRESVESGDFNSKVKSIKGTVDVISSGSPCSNYICCKNKGTCQNEQLYKLEKRQYLPHY